MFFVSFPNLLCLLLTGVLVVHMLSREDTLGEQVELLETDSLERMYCRMPQSYRKQDTASCSSAQRLFLLLGNACARERTIRRAPADNEVDLNDTGTATRIANTYHAGGEDEKYTRGGDKREQTEEAKSSVLDSFIISLLVGSAVFSLFEIYKEKAKQVVKGGGADGAEPQGVVGAAGAAGGRRISLADLTVNRHIRRGDSHQLETIRQSSVTSGKPPPLIRRSSFPAQMPEPRHRPAPQRQQSSPGLPGGRRLSVDLSEDDNSPDRRRVRIIRRH